MTGLSLQQKACMNLLGIKRHISCTLGWEPLLCLSASPSKGLHLLRLRWPLAQVNDFMADAIVSQLLLLDAQDPTKVCLWETVTMQ